MAEIHTDDRSLVPQLLPLLPLPLGSRSHIRSDNGAMPATSMATPVGQPSRKPKTQSKSADEWEARKVKIYQLYMLQDLSLPEVIRIMEREELFVQSRKQYTTKLKEWGYEKNVKGKDMAAIVRKDLKRRAEDPHRSSAFRLRGNPVPEQKIERYKSTRGIADGSDLAINAATPSDISCETPRAVAESPKPGLDPSPSLPNIHKSPNDDIASNESGSIIEPRIGPCRTISIIRVKISTELRLIPYWDLRIEADRKMLTSSTSALDVNVFINFATSHSGLYEYTLDPPLRLSFDSISKHLTKYTHRALLMFMQRHDPESDYTQLLNETTDQITILSKEQMAKFNTSHEKTRCDAGEMRPPQNTTERSMYLKIGCDADKMRPPQNTEKPSVNSSRKHIKHRRCRTWHCCKCYEGPLDACICKRCFCEHDRCHDCLRWSEQKS